MAQPAKADDPATMIRVAPDDGKQQAALVCAWCGSPMTIPVAEGSAPVVSHGICADCARGLTPRR